MNLFGNIQAKKILVYQLNINQVSNVIIPMSKLNKHIKQLFILEAQPQFGNCWKLEKSLRHKRNGCSI